MSSYVILGFAWFCQNSDQTIIVSSEVHGRKHRCQLTPTIWYLKDDIGFPWEDDMQKFCPHTEGISIRTHVHGCGTWFTFHLLIFCYFQALVNPMQAFLNSLVYRGLGGCQLCMKPMEEDLIPRRRRRQRTRADIHVQSNISTDVEQSSETAPLLSFRL